MMELLQGTAAVVECMVLATANETSKLYGEFGGDVIKNEHAGTEDNVRAIVERITDPNDPFHLACNRNSQAARLERAGVHNAR